MTWRVSAFLATPPVEATALALGVVAARVDRPGVVADRVGVVAAGDLVGVFLGVLTGVLAAAGDLVGVLASVRALGEVALAGVPRVAARVGVFTAWGGGPCTHSVFS
jgi:hypothetical protein